MTKTVTLPLSTYELVMGVTRAARKYERCTKRAGFGSAKDARRDLLAAAEACGDPAKLEATAVIDGGSVSSVTEPQVVNVPGDFNGRTRNLPAIVKIPQPRRQAGRPRRRVPAGY